MLSIFSEGFRHLVGLPVNARKKGCPYKSLMENEGYQRWKVGHMFTYFLRCFCHLYVLPINPTLTPFQTVFLQHFLFSFFRFKRLTFNAMLSSNRKMCVMHRPLICQCGRWWWAQLPGLLYSCPSHLPKRIFPIYHTDIEEWILLIKIKQTPLL